MELDIAYAIRSTAPVAQNTGMMNVLASPVLFERAIRRTISSVF